MSQWTHILGVVRYDSFNKNVWPEPPDKDNIILHELDLVSRIWQQALPFGSEGPLEVKFYNTNRGPTVLITGDLRDYGKEDLHEIKEWANRCDETIQRISFKERLMLILRDGFINCRVEYNDTKFIIEHDDDKFVLNKYTALI